MNPANGLKRLLIAIAFALLAFPVAAAPGDTVTVFAASSLTNALQDIGQAYEQKTGTKIVLSFAASSVLAKQIEVSRGADIFLSADSNWMDYLGSLRLIDTTSRMDLLGNQIVLIAPKDSTVSLTIAPGFPLAKALGNGRLAIADPDIVPAGRYAQSSLQVLGVWNNVAGQLARAENVRMALAYVARGEAPLGIVYATDAQVEPKVKVIGAFPENTHPPIVYPAALTTGASAAARAFYIALSAPEAKAVFEKYGFTVLTKS